MYWGSVASSGDGKTLIAAAPFGPVGAEPGAIFYSTNEGVNWTSNALSNPMYPYSTFTPAGVAISADGTKIVVAACLGTYYSTNSGTDWTLRTNVTLFGIASPSQYIASSADGTKLVLCLPSPENNYSPGPIYVSTNSGETWNLTSASSNQWQFVAMSANGNMIMAVPISFTQPSPIYISTDTGNTWTTNGPMLGWGALASSADGGKWVAAAATDAKFDMASGSIYVSQSLVAPQMAIAPAMGGVQLSWLVPSTNFVLQQSSDLSAWMDTTNCPALNLDNLLDQVTLPATNDSGFFRLKTP
jgi:hypothetical protein